MLYRIAISASVFSAPDIDYRSVLDMLEHIVDNCVILDNDTKSLENDICSLVEAWPGNSKFKTKGLSLLIQLKNKNRFIPFYSAESKSSACNYKSCPLIEEILSDYRQDYREIPIISTKNCCFPFKDAQKKIYKRSIDINDYFFSDFRENCRKSRDFRIKYKDTSKEQFEREFLIPIFRYAKRVKIFDRYIGRSIINKKRKIQGLRKNYKKSIKWIISVFNRETISRKNDQIIEIYTGVQAEEFSEEEKCNILGFFQDFSKEINDEFNISVDFKIKRERAQKFDFEIFPSLDLNEICEPILYKKISNGKGEDFPHARYLATDQITLLVDRGFDLLLNSKIQESKNISNEQKINVKNNDLDLNENTAIHDVHICSVNFESNDDKLIETEVKELPDLEGLTRDFQRKILIFPANPNSSIEKIEQSNESIVWTQKYFSDAQKSSFDVVKQKANTCKKFKRKLKEEKPTIIHFIGDSLVNKISFLDGYSEFQEASESEIEHVFKILPDIGIKCVILDRCYCQTQASKIAEYVPFVIVLPQSMSDNSIKNFIEKFYSTLADGENYNDAFLAGKQYLSSET